MTNKNIFRNVAVIIVVTCICIGLFSLRREATQDFYVQDTSLKTFPSTQSTEPLVVYGYLPYWTRTKAVFPTPLTHVSFFSLGIQQNGQVLNLPKQNQEAGYRAYQNGALTDLKSKIGAGQKVELTLTMMDQDAIPVFLRDQSAQDVFIQDVQTILASNQVSGINIDIEYNGLVDEQLQDNLVTLLHRLRVLLQSHNPPLSLSIATYSDAGSLQRLTHLQKIAPEVDHIIMMAYDFHRSKSPNAGPNAPLYGKSNGRWAEDIMSDLQQYSQFVPSNKILLGIPFYGYAWSVTDEKNPNSFTLPKTGESVPYANILKLLARPDVRRYWDQDALSPYLKYTIGKTTKILYYDDPQSLRYKMMLVRQAKLGGIAIWALGYDEGDAKLWQSIR